MVATPIRWLMAALALVATILASVQPAHAQRFRFTVLEDNLGPIDQFIGLPVINDAGLVGFSAALKSGGVGVYRANGSTLTTIFESANASISRPLGIDASGRVLFELGDQLMIGDGGPVAVFQDQGLSVVFGDVPIPATCTLARLAGALSGTGLFPLHCDVEDGLGQVVGSGLYLAGGGSTAARVCDGSRDLGGVAFFPFCAADGVVQSGAGTLAVFVQRQRDQPWLTGIGRAFAGGGLELLLDEGDASNPTLGGEPLATFDSLSVNDAGTVAFSASMRDNTFAGRHRAIFSVESGGPGGAPTRFATPRRLTPFVDPLDPAARGLINLGPGVAINNQNTIVFEASNKVTASGSLPGLFTGLDPVRDRIIQDLDNVPGFGNVKNPFLGGIDGAGRVVFLGVTGVQQGIILAEPLPAVVDLTVTAVTVSGATAVAVGTNVSIVHVVRNTGGTAPASTSRLYLSTNSSFAGVVAPLGAAIPVGALGPGASASVTRVVTIPAVPPGLYFVLARADDPDAIPETNENNNVGAAVARLLVGPDITVTAATTVSGAGPGTGMAVNFTLKNLGAAATGAFTVGFALVPVSANGSPTGALDIPLVETVTGLTLGPGGTLTRVVTVVLPAGLAAGRYRVRVIADSTGAVLEASELNNTLLTGVLVVALPDLAVPLVNVAVAVAAAGGNISVTLTIRNAAPAPGDAPASLAQIYLAANSSFASVVGPLGAPVNVGPLKAQASVTIVRLVAIPAGTAPGRYFVLVRADDPGLVVELSEANNLGFTVRTLGIGPDLTVTAATLAPAAALPGANVSVTHTVTNLGAVASGPFSVGYALVPVDAAGNPTGPDIPLAATRAIANLPPGATSPSAATVVVLPADLVAGRYRVRVIVDSTGAVIEASEANNAVLSAILNVVRPDFVAPTLAFTPAAVAAGSNVSVTGTVRNGAPAPGNAPASVVGLYLSLNQSFDGVVASLGKAPIPPLAAGASAPFSSKTVTIARAVVIPALTAPGRYRILARADDDDRVTEASELNNLGAGTTVLLVGPDVTVASATTAPGAAPGTSVGVVYVLRNLGATPTGNFSVGFALVPVHANGSARGTDIPLPTTRPTSLAAGATAPAVTVPLAIPTDLAAGLYRVRVIADTDNTVIEADETNNQLTTGNLNVVRGDLAVVSVVATPAAVAPGGNVSTTTTFRNVSPAPGSLPATTAAIYLSVNRSFEGVLGRLESPAATPTPLGTLDVPALAGAASIMRARSVQVPAATAPGRYTLLVRGDDPDAVLEASEANNLGFTAGTILVGADVTPTSMTVSPSAVLPGGNVTVTTKITNLGAVAVGPFGVAYTLIPVDASGQPTGPGVPVNTSAVTRLAGVKALDVSGVPASGTVNYVDTVEIPVNLRAGFQRLEIRLDPAGVVNQALTTNDALVGNIFMVVRPDLVGTNPDVTPTVVGPGTSVAITFSVRNDSPPPGDALAQTVAALFLSTNQSRKGIVASLGTQLVPPLKAKAMASFKVTRSLPSLQAGPYWALLEVDAGDAIDEYYERNWSASLKPLWFGPNPGLVSVTASPTNVALGGFLRVDKTLRNFGATTTAPTDVFASLIEIDSAGKPTGAPPTPLGLLVGGLILQPGEGITGFANLFLHPGVRHGRFRVQAEVDPGGLVPDADRGNNKLLTTGIVDVRAPELIIPRVIYLPLVLKFSRQGSLAHDVEPAAGDVTITHDVKNNALAPANAGPSISELFLSTTPDLTGVVTSLGTVPVPPVPAGATVPVTKTFTIPATVARGRYFVVANADDTNLVRESNENNNVGAAPTTLLIGNDLVPTALGAPASVLAGANLSVMNAVQNVGTPEVGPFVVGFLLRPVVPGPDVPLPTTRVVQTLAAGATDSKTTPVLIPSGTPPSDYKVVMRVDTQNDVPEASETNNERLTTTNVKVLPPPP